MMNTMREAEVKIRDSHSERMSQMQMVLEELNTKEGADPVAWLRNKLSEFSKPAPTENEDKMREKMERLRELVEQRKQIEREAASISEEEALTPEMKQLVASLTKPQHNTEAKDNTDQEAMLQQLKTVLGDKAKENSSQRELIKQFLTASNKNTTTGGVNTLKPDLLKWMLGESEEFSMAEWLARFNIQDTGESRPPEEESIPINKQKSGMLDHATMNILQKKSVATKEFVGGLGRQGSRLQEHDLRTLCCGRNAHH